MDLVLRRVRLDDEKPLMDIGIEKGRIVEIVETIETQGEEEIDAGGRAALPGFVEPHMHLDKAFLHRRLPSHSGTLEEAIRVTGTLKARQTREDVLERSRRVLDMALLNGTTFLRAHPDVDPIQGLIGVETALELREEYRDLIDIQIVAFPQEGMLKTEGVDALMKEALDMGADVVGGCPYNERTVEDARSHIDKVFDLAQTRGLPIDMHADFADDASDPRYATVRYIAEKTIGTGYQGRVALGHVTSLGALEPEACAPLIDLIRQAGIHIVTLPATDVYLGGRGDAAKPRRGLAPVRSLHEAGVNVAYSSNNIRNAFTPFGKADPLQIGNLLAHLVQFGTPEQQAEIVRMGTHNAARVIGVSQDYGLEVGRQADIVVLDTRCVGDALLDLPVRSWVLKKGRVVAMNALKATICRDCGRPHGIMSRGRGD